MVASVTTDAITVEAFEAIARTLPLGNFGYENETNERGWLSHAVVARLRAMRGPGESYSDVILRISLRISGGANATLSET